MHSLRTRITVTMLCVMLTALVLVTILSAAFIQRTESQKSDRLLMMLCESGERSLDYYFDSVQNSVSYVRYTYRGEEKEAIWRTLSNGMRLNVTAPVSETMGEWQGLILNIAMGTALVLAAASLFFMFYSRRITKPLDQLTKTDMIKATYI